MTGGSRIAPPFDAFDAVSGTTSVAEPAPVDRGLAESRPGTLPGNAMALPADGGRPGPSTPQQVALQVADAVRQAGPTGTLEVALDPEELGRVRLVFSAAEAGLAVTLQADRSETLEMLRRHADLLLSDLRARGFEDVQIDFGSGMRGGQGEASGSGRGGAATPDSLDVPVDAAATPATAPDLSAPTGGLDLRL
jgi:flagellar hook-length control protein FliK